MEGRDRVSVIHGKKPIIIVCPHGADDTNTDVIAEACANSLDSYAVINRGFERSQVVDVLKDKADCNRVDHATEEIVYEEYLKPILNFVKMSRQAHPNKNVSIYYIHGFGNHVEKDTGRAIDIILGYGESERVNSYTCPIWKRNLFIDSYRAFRTSGDVYIGKGGGKYAARASNNMTQYFRKQANNHNVDSIQIEIALRLRETTSQAELTGFTLSTVFSEIYMANTYGDTQDDIYGV